MKFLFIGLGRYFKIVGRSDNGEIGARILILPTDKYLLSSFHREARISLDLPSNQAGDGVEWLVVSSLAAWLRGVFPFRQLTRMPGDLSKHRQWICISGGYLHNMSDILVINIAHVMLIISEQNTAGREGEKVALPHAGSRHALKAFCIFLINNQY